MALRTPILLLYTVTTDNYQLQARNYVFMFGCVCQPLINEHDDDDDDGTEWHNDISIFSRSRYHSDERVQVCYSVYSYYVLTTVGLQETESCDGELLNYNDSLNDDSSDDQRRQVVADG